MVHIRSWNAVIIESAEVLLILSRSLFQTIADRYLNGEIEVDQFLKEFIEKKTLAHMRFTSCLK